MDASICAGRSPTNPANAVHRLNTSQFSATTSFRCPRSTCPGISGLPAASAWRSTLIKKLVHGAHITVSPSALQRSPISLRRHSKWPTLTGTIEICLSHTARGLKLYVSPRHRHPVITSARQLPRRYDPLTRSNADVSCAKRNFEIKPVKHAQDESAALSASTGNKIPPAAGPAPLVLSPSPFSMARSTPHFVGPRCGALLLYRPSLLHLTPLYNRMTHEPFGFIPLPAPLPICAENGPKCDGPVAEICGPLLELVTRKCTTLSIYSHQQDSFLTITCETLPPFMRLSRLLPRLRVSQAEVVGLINRILASMSQDLIPSCVNGTPSMVPHGKAGRSLHSPVDMVNDMPTFTSRPKSKASSTEDDMAREQDDDTTNYDKYSYASFKNGYARAIKIETSVSPSGASTWSVNVLQAGQPHVVVSNEEQVLLSAAAANAAAVFHQRVAAEEVRQATELRARAWNAYLAEIERRKAAEEEEERRYEEKRAEERRKRAQRRAAMQEMRENASQPYTWWDIIFGR